MLNVLNKPNTLTNFYHPNNHIIFPKNDYKYISKAKQEYNILIHNLSPEFLNIINRQHHHVFKFILFINLTYHCYFFNFFILNI